METMTVRQSSSDDRIGRLEDRMDEGFRDLRGEMKTGFDRIDARIDAFQRTMIIFSGATIAGLLGVIATQL